MMWFSSFCAIFNLQNKVENSRTEQNRTDSNEHEVACEYVSRSSYATNLDFYKSLARSTLTMENRSMCLVYKYCIPWKSKTLLLHGMLSLSLFSCNKFSL
jgi:hypothetical protein